MYVSQPFNGYEKKLTIFLNKKVVFVHSDWCIDIERLYHFSYVDVIGEEERQSDAYTRFVPLFFRWLLKVIYNCEH